MDHLRIIPVKVKSRHILTLNFKLMFFILCTLFMLNKARNNHQEVLLEMQGEISVLEATLNRLLDGSLSHYQSHLFVQSQH